MSNTQSLNKMLEEKQLPIDKEAFQLVNRAFSELDLQYQKAILDEIRRTFVIRWEARLEELREQKAKLEHDEKTLISNLEQTVKGL